MFFLPHYATSAGGCCILCTPLCCKSWCCILCTPLCDNSWCCILCTPLCDKSRGCILCTLLCDKNWCCILCTSLCDKSWGGGGVHFECQVLVPLIYVNVHHVKDFLFMRVSQLDDCTAECYTLAAFCSRLSQTGLRWNVTSVSLIQGVFRSRLSETGLPWDAKSLTHQECPQSTMCCRRTPVYSSHLLKLPKAQNPREPVFVQ